MITSQISKSKVLRKIGMGATAVIMTVGLVTAFSESAQASGSGTSNTGPAQIVDCPGLGTGDGKYCMSQNTNSCTQILC
jgi:hypothetical protein